MLLIAIICLFIIFLLILFSPTSKDEVDIAIDLYKSGDIQKAKKNLRDLLIFYPKNIRAHYYLAEIYSSVNDYDKSLQHYLKLNNIGIFTEEISELQVNKKIAAMYYSNNKSNEAFRSYLDILRIDDNDLEANSSLGFMSIGEGEFAIAQPFFEKTLKLDPDNDRAQIALSICLHENGEKEKALEAIDKLIAKSENSTKIDLKIISILLSNDSNSARGLEDANKILLEVKDNDIRLVLLRIIIYFLSTTEIKVEALEFLYKYLRDNDIPQEISHEIKYFIMILALQIKDFDFAQLVFNSLCSFKDNFPDFDEFLIFIKQKSLNISSEEGTPFATLFERNLESLIPKDLIFEISGLKTNSGINFDYFYKSKKNGKIQLYEEYAPIGKSFAFEYFQKFQEADFDKLCKFVSSCLDYKILHKERNTTENNIEFVACKNNKKNKMLISCQSFPDDTIISDIHLNNFIARFKSINVQKGLIITNASLTEGAEKILTQNEQVQIIYGELLGGWLRKFQLANRKTIQFSEELAPPQVYD